MNTFPQIALDRMLDQPPGTVFDPIPEGVRDRYCLRAASVGTFAVNLLYGVNRINPRNDLVMFYASQGDPQAHLLVSVHARALAYRGLEHHFNDHERALLTEHTGRKVEVAPAIILGIDPAVLSHITETPAGEYFTRTQVPFSGIDSYSQATLSDIFGVDVGALPLTPDAQGPDFPQLRLSFS